MKSAAVCLIAAVTLTGCGSGSGASPDELDAAIDRIEELEEALDRIEEAEPASADSNGLVELTPAAVGAQFSDAVWMVETGACANYATGSGFAVSETIVVTNQHVVQDDMAPFLARRDGRRVAARVLDSSVELDVAVLSVEEPLDAHLEWVDLDTLREGDPVISLGYPAPFNEYAVSPGTLLSFIVEDGRRIGVVSDESSDYGSSGGPLLTADGHIIGVVTEFVDAELSGQTNGQSYTYDRLGDFIEQAKQAEPKAALTCDGFEYGTNEIADSLWDLCADERYWACDSLYDLDQYLPVGGEYSDFGATCGDRVETDRYCVEEFGTMNPLQYGDDPFLDDLHDACLGADGDACDTLWMATVGFEDAAYFDVAATCGGTEEFDVVWCGDIVPELTGDP
ncbi:MAG TPA: hypothetical protein DDY35_02505 [Acidimicrobiaceae bacterium]|nr:hypothetical protein [Acidimicrobiaceae bacterium]HAI63711.1 hypothetical protein [Acidimicrobiaceae bacterium]HBH75312.1 hypothetical protein [Acidimicrobiaceae bacterium]|tara:strand:- start:578 stop:1765 length:1188 start_codon:yes stop_codon:yes gene_type:complete